MTINKWELDSPMINDKQYGKWNQQAKFTF